MAKDATYQRSIDSHFGNNIFHSDSCSVFDSLPNHYQNSSPSRGFFNDSSLFSAKEPELFPMKSDPFPRSNTMNIFSPISGTQQQRNSFDFGSSSSWIFPPKEQPKNDLNAGFDELFSYLDSFMQEPKSEVEISPEPSQSLPQAKDYTLKNLSIPTLDLKSSKVQETFHKKPDGSPQEFHISSENFPCLPESQKRK